MSYGCHQMFAAPWKMQNNEVLKPAKYFSELEKNVLLALVEKYKYVLECKKSDARTIALKQRTWQALAHEYNSQPSVSLRDFKQLKKCWENIKARTRKIMAHERREMVMRCGLASNSIKEKVASMIPEQIYYVQTPSEERNLNTIMTLPIQVKATKNLVPGILIIFYNEFQIILYCGECHPH
ncbi:unnamed protein product [Ranitomeya imitator]|uniref:Myb/SANT-like DNA-binding domain-containing protein 3 n=1 Tax=Ranitomeya imitator TaxID=111125 RepID=A0ABN9MIW6_9NEOB|nr:unnamed protein product [Ranitomeya imitator]